MQSKVDLLTLKLIYNMINKFYKTLDINEKYNYDKFYQDFRERIIQELNF